MKNIISDTIEKIKREDIRPEPRWKYLAKKYSSWMSFFLIVFIGSAVISVAFFLASQLDWDLYSTMHRFSIFYYFSLIPFIWTIPLVLLVFFAFLNLRKTENGYRYNFSKISLAVFASLFILGMFLIFSGFGGKMNAAILRDFPGYGKLITTKESQWSQPEKGLLAGTIDSVSSDSFGLQDLAGKRWRIGISQETIVRPSVDLEPGKMIKAIGQKESAQTFKASEIRPWQGKGKMKRGSGGGNGNAIDPNAAKGPMNEKSK